VLESMRPIQLIAAFQSADWLSVNRLKIWFGDWLRVLVLMCERE